VKKPQQERKLILKNNIVVNTNPYIFFLNPGTRQKPFCFAVKQQWRLLHHQNLQLQQQQRGGGGESCEWRESQGGMDGLATFTKGVVGPWG
jgi:hypothetical protein